MNVWMNGFSSERFDFDKLEYLLEQNTGILSQTSYGDDLAGSI
jgi:hypothetical protein